MMNRMLLSILLLLMPALTVHADNHPAQSARMYAEGMAWDEFLAGTKIQGKTWQKNAGRKVSAELIERLENAGDGLKLLVITAEWCPDSVHSVPYIASLAAEAGVDLRVVDFKTGRPIMNANKTPDGRASTPTVILLRGDEQVAAWVEQPAQMQWWTLDVGDEISKDELVERKMSWYDWNRGADALNEIVLLAEQTAKQASATQ